MQEKIFSKAPHATGLYEEISIRIIQFIASEVKDDQYDVVH